MLSIGKKADATIPWREEGGSVPSTWEGIAPFQEASALAVEASKLAELRAGGLNRVPGTTPCRHL